MKSMEKKRLSYIDAIKGIGILMIVWGHLAFLTDDPVMDYMGYIKIPVFYIISGMLVAMTSKQADNWQFIKSRFRRLMVPYFAMSIVMIIVNCVTAVLKHRGLTAALMTGLWTTISLRGLSTLWFLPTMFLIVVAFKYIPDKVRVLAVIFIPAIVVPLVSFLEIEFYPALVVVKSLVGLWFYLIGYFFQRYAFEYVHGWTRNIKIAVLVTLLVCNIGLTVVNGGVDIDNLGLGTYPVLYFVNGVVGCAFWIGILKLIYEAIEIKILNWSGINSLFIMITHLPLMICYVVSKACGIIVEKFGGISDLSIQYYLLITVEFLIVVAIEYVLLRIWNMMRVFPRALK